ncbi:3-hydroxyacyl-ACP dehydratase [Aquabacterium sp.]|uniref:3-hydroxyacyl-ACP dehydratase n=1 Tax=Aquabacterium sp. TaxID=1872578 RepID=UPI002BE1567E|nr:3-hydroxyacyl-ACP dehydratase [Aquabacterium sp.]HSW06631.1 3-hydroxyacyl-ACP dehydratase [Aquabacterium sp.]
MADIVCQRVIPVDHPAFAGHFPGRAILPGVLLLAEVVEALREDGQAGASMTISAAKFLAPVGPGAVLTIRVQEAGASRRFEVLQGEQRVASGALGV